MSDEIMPAAEATTGADADERTHYELAFHILPTVAEGEVDKVFEAIKNLITKAGGAITAEEAPEHFVLAYEIMKHLEGKNRKFSSAYFGWVRFKAEASVVPEVSEEMEQHKDILRHLVIKLTKVEEAHPFCFHEALASEKQVSTVEESAVVPDVTTVTKAAPETETAAPESEETAAEVDETELDKALEKSETA